MMHQSNGVKAMVASRQRKSDDAASAMIGKKFGRLTVVSVCEQRKGELKSVFCQCDCGNSATYGAWAVRNGKVKSCWCLRNECSAEKLKTMKKPIKNLCGKAFGDLTVIGHDGNLDSRKRKWQCLCVCGSTVFVSKHSLDNEKTHCGCKKAPRAWPKEKCVTKKPEYWVWRGILARCKNPKNQRWMHYGGRGIKVCRRVAESFKSFVNVVGFRPSENHSIDRIDVDAGYTCGDCYSCRRSGCKLNMKWSTDAEQAVNKTSNRFLTAFGKTMTASQWSVETGIPYLAILRRINVAKWTDERAVSLPVKKNGTRKSIANGFVTPKDKYSTAEYGALRSAIARCHQKTHQSYNDYGGRGISVCDAWRKWGSGFDQFLSDVGPKPSPHHSLDRIDFNGNYCKDNCKWSTIDEQNNNKRNCVKHKTSVATSLSGFDAEHHGVIEAVL